jgi:poly-gamma-glutamate capsule biosynthesis protein CapA/YwtB (metallophosphatase superfamily)
MLVTIIIVVMTLNSNPGSDRGVTVCAVGDVMVNRDEPGTAFELARPVFAAGDITFGNCESTYAEHGSRNPAARGEVRAHPSNVAGLRHAGFHVMSFANNHHLDAGYEAFMRTLEVLHEQGIATCGAGGNLAEARQPAIIERNGTRIAFLGYSSILFPGYEASAKAAGCAPLRVHTYYRQIETEQPGSHPYIVTVPDEGDVRTLKEDIAAAKESADVVVFTPHWGLHFTPVAVAPYERELARIAIDAGADIVLGHHQHILKGVDVYDGKVIFHGLGNFVMDVHMHAHAGHEALREMQDQYPEFAVGYREDYPTYPFHPLARRTVIARFTVERGAIARVGFVPCYINPTGQPEPLSADHARFGEVVDYVREISRGAGFETRFEPDGGGVVVCP